MKENLVTTETARAELGRPGPPLGKTFFSAVKRAMGIKARRVSVSQVREWMHKHPDFKLTDVYPRTTNPVRKECERCGKMVAVRQTRSFVNLRPHNTASGERCC